MKNKYMHAVTLYYYEFPNHLLLDEKAFTVTFSFILTVEECFAIREATDRIKAVKLLHDIVRGSSGIKISLRSAVDTIDLLRK